MLAPNDEGELRLLASIAAEHAGQPVEAENTHVMLLKLPERNLSTLWGPEQRVGWGTEITAGSADSAEQWLWDALRFARSSGDPRITSCKLVTRVFHKGSRQTPAGPHRVSSQFRNLLEHNLVSAELTARAAIAGLDRVQGELRRAEATFKTIADRALQEGLEVAALNARLQLGLCAWNRDDPEAARLAFEEVRRGARGNLFT